jgi:hypothetical protein
MQGIKKRSEDRKELDRRGRGRKRGKEGEE